jgi:SAM-dependent methyltransferase
VLDVWPVAIDHCPYCQGRDFEPWLDAVTDRLGHAPGTWSFQRCRACRSAVLHPAPAAEELAAFYPEVYSFHPGVSRGGKLGALLAGLEERFFFQLQYRGQLDTMTEVMGPPRRGARLLDVGCGMGERLLAFRTAGYAVHGLDFIPAAIEHLRRDLKMEGTCGDLLQIEELFPASSFDVVTAFQVVEHVHDPRALIARCLKIVRPGGWFVAAVPMSDSLQATVLKERWVGAREAPRHLTLPSQEGLRQACSALGIERVEIRPDSLLNCAGLVGLSLMPDAATTKAYGARSAKALLTRLLGAGVSLGSLPLCYLENELYRRPSTAILFARKPGAGAG